MKHPCDVIRCTSPAPDFAEGFPIGNGRLGGMVLGKPKNERMALNHDLLWRRSFSYEEHGAGKVMRQAADLCLAGRYREAESLLRETVPVTGRAYYTNPFVPVGDLFLCERFADNPTEYHRELDMDTGITKTVYRNDRGVLVTRESAASWEDGVLAVRIRVDKACELDGMLSLSRLGDEECTVTGTSAPGSLSMDGEFEEGLLFAVRVKVLQRGGRLKGGRRSYVPYEKNCPSAWASEYVYSHEEMFDADKGVSTGFDHTDEVLVLVAIATMDEGEEPGRYAAAKLEKFTSVRDGDGLFAKAAADHQALYRRMALCLGEDRRPADGAAMLQACTDGDTVTPEMAVTLFNFSRYLSIAAGRPQKAGEMSAAPINLQGIWQQDLRPAWDSDYHSDLNVEMCYWNMNAFHLPSLMEPLLDWAERIAPSARTFARDIFDTDGYCLACSDYFGTGSPDNVGVYSAASFGAWVCQVLWQQWRYTLDRGYLGRLYTIMREIGSFCESWLAERDGVLIMPFGTSPEMPTSFGAGLSYLTSEGSFDMELIYDLFAHLAEAAAVLEPEAADHYAGIRDRLMLPVIGEDGAIREWREYHPIEAPDHRHRSHLVGLIPGERISPERTPAYADAAWKALEKRHRYGFRGATSFTFALDGQICTRLLRPADAFAQLKMFVKGYLLPNLLSVTNDFDGNHGGIPWFVGQKLYQIEAQIAIGGVILEMFFQSRQGILRFLPAMPGAFSAGSLTDVPAEGGFTLSFDWQNGIVREAKLFSALGRSCTVKIPAWAETVQIWQDGKPTAIEETDGGTCVRFATEAGRAYTIVFDT